MVNSGLQIALSSHLDRSLADPILAALRRPGDIAVGDNQPYDLIREWTTAFPSMPSAAACRTSKVEFRQDEIADAASQVQMGASSRPTSANVCSRESIRSTSSRSIIGPPDPISVHQAVLL